MITFQTGDVEMKVSTKNKQINNIFSKAFYLNPFVLMNKIKLNDKHRIYSVACSENLFLVENDNYSHKIQEKTTKLIQTS